MKGWTGHSRHWECPCMGIAGVWSETWACAPQPWLTVPYSICHSLFELQSCLGHHLRSVCKRAGQRGYARCLLNPQGCGRGNREQGCANSFNTRIDQITITYQILYLSVFSRGTRLNSAPKMLQSQIRSQGWNNLVGYRSIRAYCTGPSRHSLWVYAAGCWKLERIFLFLSAPPGTSSATLSETRAGARLSKAGPASSSDLVLLVLGKIIPVPKHQAGESEVVGEQRWSGCCRVPGQAGEAASQPASSSAFSYAN